MWRYHGFWPSGHCDIFIQDGFRAGMAPWRFQSCGFVSVRRMEGNLSHAANFITSLRILAAPAVAILLLGSPEGSSILATLIFVGAVLTDFLDGRLARGTGTVSELGKSLDPVADRILVGSAIVALSINGALPVAGVVLVLARDIFMLLGYKLLVNRGVKLRVSLLGKAYTALIMVAVTLAMAGVQADGITVGRWLFWAGVAGSLISAVAYLARGFSLAGSRIANGL